MNYRFRSSECIILIVKGVPKRFYKVFKIVLQIINDYMGGKKEYDFVVVGGGPAGIGAAFTAAKLGLKVAVIEHHNMLGGNWTNGYVLSILGAYTYSGKIKIVGGIVDEIVDRLKSMGGTTGQNGNFIPFRPDEMKLTLSLIAKELHIDLYYSSFVTAVGTSNNVIRYVEATGKNGVTRIYGKGFVDSSGDADVAYLSKLATMSGYGKNHIHQEATLPFRIGGVNEAEVVGHSKKHPDEIAVVIDKNNNLSRIRILPKIVKLAEKRHNLYLHGTNAEFLFNTSRRGEFVCNATHVKITDFTDGHEIALDHEDARKQVASSVQFLSKYIGGFENAYLMDSASYIGLRETRRGVGEYVLTKHDVLNNARFEDAIVRCGHPVEVHDPKKGVYYLYPKGGNDSWYEIPYRSIITKGVKNLFIIGRCLSADFYAQASARVTGAALGMGQASAFAAKQMLKDNISAGKVDVKKLQDELRKFGAIL